MESSNHNVDVIISGNRHFLSLDIEHPAILTPSQYKGMFDYGI